MTEPIPDVQTLKLWLQSSSSTLWGKAFNVHDNPQEEAIWLYGQLMDFRIWEQKRALEKVKTLPSGYFGYPQDAGDIPDERLLEDGFGSMWEKCHLKAECGMHVVRPGKADCYKDDCPGRPE